MELGRGREPAGPTTAMREEPLSFRIRSRASPAGHFGIHSRHSATLEHRLSTDLDPVAVP